jgi:hypothetical protein
MPFEPINVTDDILFASVLTMADFPEAGSPTIDRMAQAGLASMEGGSMQKLVVRACDVYTYRRVYAVGPGRYVSARSNSKQGFQYGS